MASHPASFQAAKKQLALNINEYEFLRVIATASLFFSQQNFNALSLGIMSIQKQSFSKAAGSILYNEKYMAGGRS